jgi:hypothetical protein
VRASMSGQCGPTGRAVRRDAADAVRTANAAISCRVGAARKRTSLARESRWHGYGFHSTRNDERLLVLLQLELDFMLFASGHRGGGRRRSERWRQDVAILARGAVRLLAGLAVLRMLIGAWHMQSLHPPSARPRGRAEPGHDIVLSSGKSSVHPCRMPTGCRRFVSVLLADTGLWSFVHRD